MRNLWTYAITPQTHSTYETGASTYFKFLSFQGTQWNKGCMPPVTDHLLMLFCTYCENQLHLRYSTIRLYLCGVRFYYLKSWGFNPLEKSNGHSLDGVQSILSAIKKKQVSNVKRERLPITADILLNLCKFLSSGIVAKFDSLMLKAAFLVAFFVFLRCGELTVSTHFDPHINLCVEDVIVLNGCIYH